MASSTVSMKAGVRKHETGQGRFPEASEFYVMPIADNWSEEVCGLYVERFWLPIVSPSAFVVSRRLAMWNEGFTFDTKDLAHSFGLGGERFMDAVKRLVDFRLMRRDTKTNRIGYATAWPRVPDERQDRWPAWLAEEHEQWLRDQVAA